MAIFSFSEHRTVVKNVLKAEAQREETDESENNPLGLDKRIRLAVTAEG
jgi:hypothetical protein